MLLTHEIPSLSVWNVWDLPLWAWRQYEAYHDAKAAEARRASAP